ncbi:hypothetical protein KDN34_02515 [Shewanella yunxiaonensis]|uniref:Uncharacterized protein n=1 Tax=Shewanella yunxiaonensis TaxID=2829809 RepID=A0ABX7YUC8_9GAMM|nr:hypothetical protein [Shewanella yunxiaonensis]QUN06358.1 hypothetical protein KDN34_02515 [Shewanella yunxiaonensis]
MKDYEESLRPTDTSEATPQIEKCLETNAMSGTLTDGNMPLHEVKSEMMGKHDKHIESDAVNTEVFTTQKSDSLKAKIDDCDAIGLGNPKYRPTQEEVEKTVNNICILWSEFKYYLYLVFIHEMYKRKPYNCKTISEFVSKHLQVSRATVYRAIVEISVNIAVYDEYDWKHPKINSNICQKLNRILQTQSVYVLKIFWQNLNKKCDGNITAKLVEQEIYYLMRFGHYSDGDTHKDDLKIPSRFKPINIQNFENKYDEGSPIKSNKNYNPYASFSGESDDEPEDESDDDFEDELDFEFEDELDDEPEDESDDEFEDESDDEPEDESDDEFEDELDDEPEDESDDEFEDESDDEPKGESDDEPEDESEFGELEYIVNAVIKDSIAHTFGGVYTAITGKCIDLLLHMHPAELIVIVECAEQILAKRESYLSQLETD